MDHLLTNEDLMSAFCHNCKESKSYMHETLIYWVRFLTWTSSLLCSFILNLLCFTNEYTEINAVLRKISIVRILMRYTYTDPWEWSTNTISLYAHFTSKGDQLTRMLGFWLAIFLPTSRKLLVALWTSWMNVWIFRNRPFFLILLGCQLLSVLTCMHAERLNA